MISYDDYYKTVFFANSKKECDELLNDFLYLYNKTNKPKFPKKFLSDYYSSQYKKIGSGKKLIKPGRYLAIYNKFAAGLRINKKDYTEDFTLKLIQDYEKKYNKIFPKDKIKNLISSHKKCIKENKKLLTPAQYLNLLKRTPARDKQVKELGQKYGKTAAKNLKKWREDNWDQFIEIVKSNGRKAGNFIKENHPEQFSEMGKLGGLITSILYPEIAPINLEKAHEANRKNNYEIQKQTAKKNLEIYHIDKIGAEVFSKLNQDKKHQSEAGKKGVLAILKKIEEGDLNLFNSKEENDCRQYLEKVLNVKFKRAIWIKNPDITTIDPVNKIATYHPYDFGLLDKKLLIEYDGEYWHKNTKIRDKYWTKVANDLGYTLIRIKDKDWKNKKEQQKIINNIAKILNK